MSYDSGVKNLLERTMLRADQFKSFLAKLAQEYPRLGKIKTISPFTQGYEDANFALLADGGKYVLKIFAEDMAVANAKAHARILSLANKVGFPVAPIVANKKGKFLSTILDNFSIVTVYIEGNSFNDLKPSLEDMIAISKSLTKLNKLTEKLSVSYDSWSNSELLWEYKRDKRALSSESLDFLLPTIRKMRMLDTDEFQSGLIHGDIQPNHVLKGNNGGYFILDFGVARNDLLVYELSTCLAWFCLPDYSIKEYDFIIEAVIQAYEESIPLSKAEKESLPTLIEAAYAAYFFRTEVLKTQDVDEETGIWNRKARSLLTRWRQYCS